MDIFTHSLTGVLMSRLLPLPRAGATTLLLIAASNIPDLDKYGVFTNNPEAYFTHHRSHAHALLFAPALAILCLLVYRIFKPITPCLAAATLAAVLLHDLTDTLNPHGVRLLLTWFHADLITPWDLIFVSTLTIAVGIPPLLAIVDSEISRTKTQHPSPIAPLLAIAIILTYTGARWISHNRAIAMMTDVSYRGTPAKRVSAFPTGVSLTRWRAIVEGKDFVYELPLDLTDVLPVRDQYRIDLPEHGASIEAARTTHTFQVVERIARIPVWTQSRALDPQEVQLIDLRFGPSSQPQLSARALINPNGAVRSLQFYTGSLFWD